MADVRMQTSNEVIEKRKNAEKQFGLASSFYNAGHANNKISYFEKAAIHYQNGINELLGINTKSDDDLRDLVNLYINLCDTHSALSNFEAACKALNAAQLAFIKIKNKDKYELEVSDPVKNFKKFYEFIQQNLTTKGLLDNPKFKERVDNLYRQYTTNTTEKIKPSLDYFNMDLDASTSQKGIFAPAQAVKQPNPITFVTQTLNDDSVTESSEDDDDSDFNSGHESVQGNHSNHDSGYGSYESDNSTPAGETDVMEVDLPEDSATQGHRKIKVG